VANCGTFSNPDEAVALGAAIQGGGCGEVENLLLDVTPLSGIETLGEVKAIERTWRFRLASLKSFYGNWRQTSRNSRPPRRTSNGLDNKSLGKFLYGIPPAPRGEPQIEVSFEIDVNGILKVSSRQRYRSRTKYSDYKHRGLSALEVERMRQEAEIYAEQDKKGLNWLN